MFEITKDYTKIQLIENIVSNCRSIYFVKKMLCFWHFIHTREESSFVYHRQPNCNLDLSHFYFRSHFTDAHF